MSNSTNGTHHRPYKTCKEVSDLCPVELTTLGYYPNVGINIFFAIGFGIALVAVLVTGIWKKTWSYMSFIAAGCILELAGYVGRVLLHDNPWNKQAFETQICAIILGPTLICISIYLTLKHLCICLNPALSRIRPTLYPFIFVPADVSCLLVQAVGGALAASAGDTSKKLLDGGNRAIIAGICLQVVVLAAFGISSIDYFVRAKRWIKTEDATPEAKALWFDKKFRWFAYAVTVAFACILIRCIYRIAEMAGGWGSTIMQDEPSFIVLDGFMVLIAVILLSFFAPGFLFPHMAEQMRSKKKSKKSKEDKSSSTAGDESQDPEQGMTEEPKALMDREHELKTLSEPEPKLRTSG